MIQFSCTACKKSFSVPDRAAGRGTNCPHCGQRLVIPVAAKVQKSQTAPDSSIPSKSQATTSKPPPRPQSGSKPAKPPTPPRSVESPAAASKDSVPTSPDRERSLNAAMWGLIGGTGVAVTALIIGLVIPRSGKPSAAEVKQDEQSARQVLAEADSGANPKEAPAPKLRLSAEALYAKASPGVVTIICKNDLEQTIYSGSGFFVNEKLVHDPKDETHRLYAKFKTEMEKRPLQFGHVLTNYHVIDSAINAEVTLGDGSKGTVLEITNEDETADLALLAVNVNSAKSITSLELAANDSPVGTTVYAIGSPRGFANSLSAGVISGSGREIEPGVRWLQTTASISPGSSGGPLLNPHAEVVGVTTRIRRDSQNLNFAVPASELRRFLGAAYRGRELWQGRSYHGQEESAFWEWDNWCGIKRLEAGKPPLPENAPESRLRKACFQMWDKEYEKVIDAVTEVVSAIPPEFRYLAHYVLGKAHLKLAIKQAGKGATVEESFKNFSGQEHAERALQFLKEAARLNPKFVPNFALLAEYHLNAGEWPEGLIAADALVKLMPHCADAYSKRGEFYLQLHRASSALKDLQMSLKLNPQDSYVQIEIGDAWADLQEYDKAVDAYKTALSMNHRNPGYCHYRIGGALQEAGKYPQAIAAYEKAQSLGFNAKSCELGVSLCRQMMR